MARRPSPGNISSSYGMRNGRLHAGEDIGWAKGLALYAPISGKITYRGYLGNYGNLLKIYDAATKTEIRLGHMAGFAVPLNAHVTEGQHVGTMGSTGNAQGVHVHWEVRVNGVLQNPATWLKQQQTKPTTNRKPITEQKEELMKPVLFRRTGTDKAEWSLAAPYLTGSSALERGYYVITNQAEAKAAARLYANGFGSESQINRTDYIKMQETARKVHECWMNNK